MASQLTLSASAAADAFSFRRRAIFGAAVTLAAGAGLSLAALTQNNAVGVSLLLALFVATVIWIAPWTALVAVMLGATLVEQFTLIGSGSFTDATDQIPLFRSLSSAGLPGVYATPFELLLGFVLLMWLARGFARRQLHLPKSKLAAIIGLFLFLVLVALLRGLSEGANPRNALWELRPWMYLGLTFLLSSQLVTQEKHFRILLWAFAVGVGIKATQGLVLFILHPADPRPQSYLEHAESFFFGVFLALTLGLWLLSERGRMRQFMTAVAPLVLVSDMLNQRRTAWAILALLLAATLLLVYVRLPQRRKLIVFLVIVICIVSGAYYAAFSKDPGTLGQPARAFDSVVFPTARDKMSNQYRNIENVDLGIAIRQTTPLGSGFGRQIPQPVQNVNIVNVDSFINYVPHNGILYVWLRFGLMGAITFWMMIATAILLACRVFQSERPTIRLLAFVVILAVIAYIVQGFYDMGLFWFRIAAVMGTLLGSLEVAHRLEEPQTVERESRSRSGVKPRVAVTPLGAGNR